MKNKRFLLSGRYAALPAALLIELLRGGEAQAIESERVMWDVNGHYYQSFRRGPMLWNDAKKACEAIGGHLATITSQAEQNFIQTNFIGKLSSYGYQDYYHIGGTDAASQYDWKWITGEPWGYQNWGSGQPSDRPGKDYLLISAYDGTWADDDLYLRDTGSYYLGYICEWSRNNAIDTAVVPDMNGNGAGEIAALWVDYRTGDHTVQIKDQKTGSVLSTLTFARSFTPPQGMVVIKDLNGNHIPEIGVLYMPDSQVPTVQIKDAKNNATILKKMSFFRAGYVAKAVTASADTNGNGSSEIIVLGRGPSKDQAEMRDSKTNAVLKTTSF